MPKRLFDNPNLLDTTTLSNRIQALDANGIVEVINETMIMSGGQSYIVHLVAVTCALTDAQIILLLSTASTAGEALTLSRLSASKQNAKNIPSWATWTEAQAQTWGTTNIGTPLTTGRSSLPATLTFATTRAAIIAILNILDQMWAMQWALARMIIATRDKIWPDLPQT